MIFADIVRVNLPRFAPYFLRNLFAVLVFDPSEKAAVRMPFFDSPVVKAVPKMVFKPWGPVGEPSAVRPDLHSKPVGAPRSDAKGIPRKANFPAVNLTSPISGGSPFARIPVQHESRKTKRPKIHPIGVGVETEPGMVSRHHK